MIRGHSDGDLDRVDRKRTFDRLSPSSELLARVVTALGSLRAAEEDAQSGGPCGIHGFTDAQILASERMQESRPSLAYSDGSYIVPPDRKRTRAASDFRAPPIDQLQSQSDHHKWTWSGGNAQIQEFLRLRQTNKRKANDLYRASFALPKTGDSVLVNIEPPSEGVTPAPSSPPSRFGRWNPFKKLIVDAGKQRRPSYAPDRLEIDSNFERNATGRQSRLSLSPHQYLNSTAKGRCSNFSILSTTDDNNVDVLEKTTIADLIRALEGVHRAQASDGSFLHDLFDDPKRGTTANAQPPMINVHPPIINDSNRRSSVQMFSSRTPIFNRAMMARRQSNILDILPMDRRASLLRPPFDPSGQPPPAYTETTMPHRRFSVRPTMLSIPPGQAPFMFHSRMRPSPLASEVNSARASGRYNRSISMAAGSVTSAQATPLTRRQNTLQLLPLDERLTAPASPDSETETPKGTGHRQRSESK